MCPGGTYCSEIRKGNPHRDLGRHERSDAIMTVDRQLATGAGANSESTSADRKSDTGLPPAGPLWQESSDVKSRRKVGK